jgi:hypothetical protein
MRESVNQGAFKIRTDDLDRRVEIALGLSRGDPVTRKEYISPNNQGRFSVIGKLESGVSMLQSAIVNIKKIRGWLGETREFLEKDRHRSSWARIPPSVINNFLLDRLSYIKTTTESASFQGRGLLNGDSGVRGDTTDKRARFIRGSARVISSPSRGYPLAIHQAPRPSVLMGEGLLSRESLRAESAIAIREGTREVVYKIGKEENADSLVSNLRRLLTDQGLDIGVFRSRNNTLFLRHNQLGSRNGFKGISYRTRLISDTPGQYVSARPGVDVAGTIGEESAHGDGGFLIGDKGNRNTDGLVVYFDGEIEFPGQVVDHVKVRQNGILIPLDSTESQVEVLSVPSLVPELLAAGVSNYSGFSDLASIRGNTEAECRDALRLIVWSMTYLEFLRDELKWKEKVYVDRAVGLLRSTIHPRTNGEEMMYLSKEKARDMVDQLKTMLTPSTAMRITSPT